MDIDRIAIIDNPKGGSHRTTVVAALTSNFQDRGVEVIRLTTTPEPGSATKLAREAIARGAQRIIAVGGDGTLCQVCEGAKGSRVPVVPYPGGTGNLFNTAYAGKIDIDQFCHLALTGPVQAIDMVELIYTDTGGKLHERFFMVAFGLGKVSDAVSMADPDLKRLFGVGAYVANVAKASINPNPIRYNITTETAHSTETLTGFFALNVAPPKFAMLSRGANASDGLLDVVLCKGKNIFQIAALASKAAVFAPDTSKHYRRFRARAIAIETSEPVIPNIDGDPGEPTQQITLTVRPGAVNMVLCN